MRRTIRPYCLSIAGFDPSGGAGILADIKTFETMKCYGLGVASAITWQNESEFVGLRWHDPTEIEQQLKPLAHLEMKAAKIGLIESMERMIEVASTLKTMYPGVFLVWDPIIKASAGFNFHEDLRLAGFFHGLIDLITPNEMEFHQLGFDVHLPDCAVLLKGGHRTTKNGIDTLFQNGQKLDIPGKPIHNKADKHGTGCVLSAAIVACLAKGNNLLNACTHAKRYTESFIQSNEGKLGYHTE
jgi:hydroxymethylpyrimidine/phosphomethylpyrimidine kinase